MATTNLAPSSSCVNDLVQLPKGSVATAPSMTSATVFQKVLRQAVAAVCTTSGFDAIQPSTLETITHILNSYLNAICVSAKLNCEIAGRNVAIPTDVWLALVNMGHDVASLPLFLQQVLTTGSVVIAPPKTHSCLSNLAPLRVGRSRMHPPHINEFLPPFPDPHTYIRTEISGEPDTSYEKVREMAAQRKRDTEQSLVDYMLRVHPRTSLFREYEDRVKEEARQAMADRDRQREARAAARRQARATQRMRKSLASNKIPDQLTDEDIFDNGEEEAAPSESSAEEDNGFVLEETETSLVRRKIPTYCSVLDPSLESRPYLSCLVSEELADDENVESTVCTQSGNQNNTNIQGDEQVYDNAFLRPPRMPQKTEFMMEF